MSLSFTAPGDDGRCGTAARYDVRVSGQPITDASFGSATPVTAAAPKPGGSKQTLTVSVPASARYIAVRAVDALHGTAAQPVNLGPASYARIGGGSVAAPTRAAAPRDSSLPTTGPPMAPPLLAAALLALVARLRRRRA